MNIKKLLLRISLIPIGIFIEMLRLGNQGARDIMNKIKYPHSIIDRGCCFTDDSIIGKHSHLFSKCTVNHSHIGKYTYIGRNSLVQNTTIGNYCSISHDFNCGLGNHPLDQFSTSPIFYKKNNPLHISIVEKDSDFQEYKHISIGHDVWIGARVTILDGVKIGNGAVIASGAVVTRDIPPYAIAGGIPAKIIKYRVKNDHDISIPQEWWDYHPLEIITLNKK